MILVTLVLDAAAGPRQEMRALFVFGVCARVAVVFTGGKWACVFIESNNFPDF